MITDAHRALCEALDDDEGVIRIAGLIAMPSFAIKKHDDLFIYLSDRLLEENEQVRKAARDCLRKVAPIFPSGCEEILRRELRHETKQHRNDAFATLKDTSRNWVETGCLHLDELIREEDVDLRRRGAKILRTITSKGGATGWDLITWSLQDEDAQVRRSASACLPTLANVESRVATILVESSMLDEDSGVKKNVIKTLKTLDMESPRVAQLIQDGARDRDPDLRKACIGQLSIILTGDKLREVAAELLRQETRPELRTRLERLSRDVDWEGTEEEKNRALAPLDKVPEQFSEMQLPEIDELKPTPEEIAAKEGVSSTDNIVPPRSGEPESSREGHKQESGRRAARKQDERDF
jgi:3-methyladenine DNA glycosylase AlkC